MDERSLLCKFYFDLGLMYKQILGILAQVHKIKISMSTLKRILRSKNLYRRKKYADILEVATFIESKINSTGSQHGHRWMHLQCRHNGLHGSHFTEHS